MVSEEVRIAFEQQVLLLALNDILPSKVLAPRLKETTSNCAIRPMSSCSRRLSTAKRLR
jgi:hypothetical protein